MKDNLGDRMKGYYESRFQTELMRRTYTMIRIDGKAFHTYTKGLNRPFDDKLVSDMNETAVFLCKNIQGAKLAFVQSDEISILVTDFDELTTHAWFDNSVQKMVSVSASLATGKFNQLRADSNKLAFFDSRVFQLPNKSEVENYFVWRQQDTVRNSISSVAQSLYSHKELMGKSSNEMQEMIFQKGINWNDYHSGLKRGRLIKKVEYYLSDNSDTMRTKWEYAEVPIFTKEKHFLSAIIPENI